METARFVLTPFYECIDTIIPLTKLRITNLIPDVKPGRFIGNQLLEFSLQLDHSFLLSESKKHKSNKFDIRAIIRFSNIEDLHRVDDQFTLKDIFPIHLKLNLNNTLITLPQFLPNDRTGKDGRRFPRPVDLSEGLLDNPLVINKFLIQWVQDDCKKESFYFAVYLVRRRTCEELSQILLKKQLSPIQNTQNFIAEHSSNHNTNQDDDLMLVNNTINTSLICPVSRVRMSTPVRGQHCTHLQCFDCVTYLIMNFNKPTWQCPVCDKKTFFCYLEVDSLILGILNDLRSKSVDGVIFNKSGQWKPDNKTPGMANEDESLYNDISNYPNAIDHADPTKSHLTLRSEPFTEFNEEKYLQRILQTSNRMSCLARFRHPSQINNMFPAMPKTTVPNCVPIVNPLFPDPLNRNVFNSPSNQQPHSLYNTTGAFQDNIRHISSVASSMNLNPNQPNIPMRYKIGMKTSDQLSNYLINNRVNQLHNQKSKLNSYLGDGNSQIKITNVTSMAKNQNGSNVIVISDDENDDVIPSSSNKESTVKMCTRAHKRPTTVSSVPSTISSAKSQKLTDNYGSQIPLRAYAASAPSVLNSQLIECCCTPNNMCIPHREILLRNKMSMINEAGIVRDSNSLKLHEIVDLTQTNLQMENYQKSISNIDGNVVNINNNTNNNNNTSYEQQAHGKMNNLSKIQNPQAMEFTHQNHRSTVKEFLKSLQNPGEKPCNDNNNANRMRNLLNNQFTVQHRPVEPSCQMSPEYVHQQWLNMMMSSSQQYPIPQNLLNTSPQLLQNNSVSQKNLNSLVNQSNGFFNC